MNRPRRHGPATLASVQGHLRLLREDEHLPIEWWTADYLREAARARMWRRVAHLLWWCVLILAALLVVSRMEAP